MEGHVEEKVGQGLGADADEETSLKLNETNLLSEATDARGSPDREDVSLMKMDSADKENDA